MSPKPVNWKEFFALNAELDHVAYGYGDKPKLTADPTTITAGDCSWYSRYMLYNSAGGLIIPDGSIDQREWCQINLPEVPYTASPGALTIAFMTPGKNGTGDIGHVWFVKDGRTYECHGGEGVDSRYWDNDILKTHVYKSFNFPLVQATVYKLYDSAGRWMDDLLTFDSHAYVQAAKCRTWFGIAVGWDAKTGKVLLNNTPATDTRLIKSDGFVPFADVAAAAADVHSYTVDNAKREIHLERINS